MFEQIYQIFFIGFISSILKEFLIIIISPLFKSRLYYNSNYDKAVTMEILKNIKEKYIYSTYTIETLKNNYPIGFVFGYWFISIIEALPSDNNGKIEPKFNIIVYSLFPLIDKKDVNNKIEENNTDPIIDEKLIQVYRRYDSSIVSDYKITTISFNNTFVTNTQRQIVDRIKYLSKLSKINGFNYGGVFLITGEPGLGKSIIPRILAQEINGKLCDDFELTSPGSSIEELIETINPTEDSPLVLLIDEHDKNILRIQNEKIENHKWYRTIMTNKDTHNRFFDKLQDFDNIITILTSNKEIDWFSNIDKSFIRPGRINISIHINTLSNSNIKVSIELLNTGNNIASLVNNSRYSKKKKL